MNNLAWLGAVSVVLVACGGSSSSSAADGGGADGGSATTDGATTDGRTGDAGSSDGGAAGDTGASGDGAVAACAAPTVNLTFASCPAAPTCGGTIVDGTYYYAAGCLDLWTQAKMACPSLTVSSEQGTVKGCVSFTSGIVARDVSTTYGATANVPMACLVGQTCAQVQATLSAYFQTVSCASSAGGCTCTVSSTYAATASGTYTTSNNQIVTSVGNHYDYCMSGGDMAIAWASGPTVEPGSYTLTKQ